MKQIFFLVVFSAVLILWPTAGYAQQNWCRPTCNQVCWGISQSRSGFTHPREDGENLACTDPCHCSCWNRDGTYGINAPFSARIDKLPAACFPTATAVPTAVATAVPTVVPTAVATVVPTVVPTAVPTATRRPARIRRPTINPTVPAPRETPPPTSTPTSTATAASTMIPKPTATVVPTVVATPTLVLTTVPTLGFPPKSTPSSPKSTPQPYLNLTAVPAKAHALHPPCIPNEPGRPFALCPTSLWLGYWVTDVNGQIGSENERVFVPYPSVLEGETPHVIHHSDRLTISWSGYYIRVSGYYDDGKPYVFDLNMDGSVQIVLH